MACLLQVLWIHECNELCTWTDDANRIVDLLTNDEQQFRGIFFLSLALFLSLVLHFFAEFSCILLFSILFFPLFFTLFVWLNIWNLISSFAFFSFCLYRYLSAQFNREETIAKFGYTKIIPCRSCVCQWNHRLYENNATISSVCW